MIPGLRRWPLLLSLTAFLLSLGAALHAALRWTEGRFIYALDDAYIHMAVARNLAEHGVWGCTPFHFSSSSSSLLWTFGLAVAYRLFGTHDLTPLVLNAALAAATLLLADRSLARFGVGPRPRAVTLLGLVVSVPMAGMVLMGMEHVAHLLLTLWFATLAVETLSGEADGTARPHRRTASLCVLGALLGASRYEGLFLVGLVCLGFLIRRQLLRGVSIGIAALLPIAAFGAISKANGALFLPNSLMLKATGESASALSALFKPFGFEDLAFLQNNRAMPILLVFGVACAVIHFRLRRQAWRPQVLFPALLAAMIVVHGHFVFSPMYWVYRYDAYLVGFGVFVAAGALASLPLRWTAAASWPAALLVAVLVVAVADVRQGVFPATEIEGMRKTYLEHYQTAQFLRLYYPSSVVVVNDLGAVTYYNQSRILDVVGLGDLEPILIMRRTGGYTSSDVREWTSAYRPKIAVIQLGWSWVAPLVPADWIRVAVVEVPPNGERVGFFAVDPSEAWSLRERVAQHFRPLSASLGYALRLRRPEGVTAAGAVTRPAAAANPDPR